MSYWDILPMPCPLISDYSRWHKNLLIVIISLLTPFWIKLSSISSQFPYQVSFSLHLETSLRGPDTYCQHVCLGRLTRKTSWVNWHQTDILMSHKNGEPSIQQKQTSFLDLLRNSLSQNQEMAIFLLNTGRSGRSNCPPVQLHAVGWHRYPVTTGSVPYRWTIDFLKFFLYQHLPIIFHPFTWNNSMSCNM